MKKTIFVLAICILLLTGCAKNYSRGDVEEFLRSKNIKNCEVAQTPREFKDEKGCVDKIWAVKDTKTGLEFSVVDDRHYTSEKGLETSRLWTDYEYALLNGIKDKLPPMKFININIQQNSKGTYRGHLVGEFKNLKEMEACYAELNDLQKYFEQNKYYHFGNIGYTLKYMNPLRNKLEENELKDGDVSSKVKYIAKGTGGNIFYRPALMVIDYRLDDIKTFSDEYIKETVKQSNKKIGIYSGDKTKKSEYEKEKIRYYDDLAVCHNNGSISLGTLYEMLKREGFKVSGNSWHYSFEGTNGDKYEVSYDFCDYPYKAKNKEDIITKGYYYIKNGEKMPMKMSFSCRFFLEDIMEMTGLKPVIYKIIYEKE